MIGRLIHLCERAGSVVGTLPQGEQSDARRLLALCENYSEQTNEPEGEAASEAARKIDEAFTRELSRLLEYVARRHAHGIPLATLARAVLAHQSNHHAFYIAACAEAEQKFGLLGF
jgi:CRISPR/Cas system-associated endonuclease Cas1